MAVLTREAILGADDLPVEDVAVPEWGGTVRIRTMTGTERDAFESALIGTGGKDKSANLRNLRARFASLVIVDDDNSRMFDERDIKELGKKSASALDRVLTAGQRLNGLSREDVDELGEDMAGDTAGSTSDLHSLSA